MKTIILLVVNGLSLVFAKNIESCDHKIFCQGKLLHTVQMSGIFKDSKTFVDHSLKYSVNKTISDFNKFMSNQKDDPSKESIKKFVNDYFENQDEIESWTLPDYVSHPKFLDQIKKSEIKKFAKDLVNLWPKFAKKVKKNVFKEPEKHSLIPLPKGFVIPGGRFREVYYWDSYWTFLGLLLSEMTQTVKGMLENLLYLVDRFGFIPNGARVYYLNRSQPPMLVLMMKIYLDKTNDVKFLKKHIETLEKELNFWLAHRTVQVSKNGVTYKLARYAVESNTPRPESYSEDIKTCGVYSSNSKQQFCNSQLKSGSESGMDFSSRWMADKNKPFNLSLIEPSKIIPVDLNSILFKDFSTLTYFFNITSNREKSKYWSKIAEKWKTAIKNVLYNPKDGIWYDFNLKTNEQIKKFYPSNFAPLWANAFDLKDSGNYGQKAAEYLDKQNLLKFKGGIPASLQSIGQQWDMPNAWAPSQEIIITGLYDSNSDKAKNIAEQLAKNWINTNMEGYKKQGVMFEKYNAEKVGQTGSGGEYSAQTGFGWTNGVALYLINKFNFQ